MNRKLLFETLIVSFVTFALAINTPKSVSVALDGIGLYYDTPSNEVAYNVQIVKTSNSIINIYHGEPYGLAIGSNGDSVKTAYAPFSYAMPSSRHYALYNLSGMSGGPANPMLIRGLDGAWYIFHIVVNSGRHYLAMAKSHGFSDMYLWTVTGWVSYNGTQTPATLYDVDNNPIRSNNVTEPTQGLIGSIAYVNGLYYYFYTDTLVNDPGIFRLYVRTTPNFITTAWSAPISVSTESLAVGILFNIQKAYASDRWSIVYTCYTELGTSNICVKYASDLTISSLGVLTYFDLPGYAKSGSALHISGVNFSQPEVMTDEWGNLAIPPDMPQTCDSGGLVTWMDINTGNLGPWGANVYWAKWLVSDCDVTGTPTPTQTVAPTYTITPTQTITLTKTPTTTPIPTVENTSTAIPTGTNEIISQSTMLGECVDISSGIICYITYTPTP